MLGETGGGWIGSIPAVTFQPLNTSDAAADNARQEIPGLNPHAAILIAQHEHRFQLLPSLTRDLRDRNELASRITVRLVGPGLDDGSLAAEIRTMIAPSGGPPVRPSKPSSRAAHQARRRCVPSRSAVVSAIVLHLHSITRFHIGSPRGVVPMSVVDESTWPQTGALLCSGLSPRSFLLRCRVAASRWIEQTYCERPCYAR